VQTGHVRDPQAFLRRVDPARFLPPGEPPKRVERSILALAGGLELEFIAQRSLPSRAPEGDRGPRPSGAAVQRRGSADAYGPRRLRYRVAIFRRQRVRTAPTSVAIRASVRVLFWPLAPDTRLPGIGVKSRKLREFRGDPGGIRTRDLDLERVASWARLDDGVSGRSIPDRWRGFSAASWRRRPRETCTASWTCQTRGRRARAPRSATSDRRRAVVPP
jgi:hypothetical protein